MPQPGIEARDSVLQREVRLGELELPDLISSIVDITGARVTSKHPSGVRTSLLLRGYIIGFNNSDWQHEGEEGPFLSVSMGGTMPEIPSLVNPFVRITPDSVTFIEISEGEGGTTVRRRIKLSRTKMRSESSI